MASETAAKRVQDDGYSRPIHNPVDSSRRDNKRDGIPLVSFEFQLWEASG